MVLPSLADLLIIVVLLVPGFVCLFITCRIAAIRRRFSELEFTVWSLFLSLIIYVPFSLTTGINDLDQIRDKIFFPGNFVLLMVYTLLTGIVLGAILKNFRPGMLLGDPWNIAFDRVTRRGGKFVIIYTESGLEYKGFVHLSGAEQDSKELSIKYPKLILRDKDWNIVDEIAMGKEILFTERDIRRVLFFEKLDESGSSTPDKTNATASSSTMASNSTRERLQGAGGQVSAVS